MAIQAKQPYTTASPVLQVFDHTDIDDGTNTVVYDGSNTVDNSATSYFLTRQTMDSGEIKTFEPADAIDVDFDVTFNVPKTVKGNVRINATIGTDSVTVARQVYLTATIYHFDGSTETSMGTVRTESFLSDSDTAVRSKRVNLVIPVTVAEGIHFEEGQILRLTIQVTPEVGNGNFGFAHDPADRNDGGASPIIEDDDSTTLKLHIPFLDVS